MCLRRARHSDRLTLYSAAANVRAYDSSAETSVHVDVMSIVLKFKLGPDVDGDVLLSLSLSLQHSISSPNVSSLSTVFALVGSVSKASRLILAPRRLKCLCPTGELCKKSS